MNPKYSEEQFNDIKGREEKAVALLNELHLAPQAQVTKAKIVTTNDIEMWADRIQPYLADTKYILDGDKYVEAIKSTDAEVNPMIGKPTE